MLVRRDRDRYGFDFRNFVHAIFREKFFGARDAFKIPDWVSEFDCSIGDSVISISVLQLYVLKHGYKV